MSSSNEASPSINQPEYEFSSEQNRIIGDLARKMHLVGVFLTIFGILGIISGLMGIAKTEGGSFIQGLLIFLVGNFTIDGARAFRKVVRTQGRDMTNLMEGMRSLSRAYGIIYWIIIIALIFICISVILLLLTTAGVSLFDWVKK